ncbi:MAG: DsbE family thiol:disulfide interchange protein [Pseudomonadota bacterium]
MTRWLPIIAIIAMLSLLGWTLFQQATREPEGGVFTSTQIEDPLISRVLPELPLEAAAWPVEGYDPDTVEGPYLLNVWASWCTPCRIEHPVLTEIAESGIPIYAINYKDRPENAQRFLNELGDPFAGIAIDFEGRAGFELGLTGAPETFIIDANNVVRARFRGAVTDVIWRNRLEPVWLSLDPAETAPPAESVEIEG